MDLSRYSFTPLAYSNYISIQNETGVYTEKYLRNEDDIDSKLKDRYSAHIQDAQAKTPQMTAVIRGKDNMRLDTSMNKLVWGGKADMTPKPEEPPPSLSGGSSSSSSSDEDDDEDSSSSSSRSDEEDYSLSADGEESAETKKERRRRRKERRRKRKERKLQKQKQKEEAAVASKKFVMQSVAAGVTLSAVAVVASVLLGSRRN